MTDQDLITLLKSYNLDQREAQFYLALLRRPEISAGELHRITGISRPRAYEILAAMVAKGMVEERKSGKHRLFQSVKPVMLIEKLEHQLEQQRDTARRGLEELERIHAGGLGNDRPLDPVEVLRGREMINRRYVALVRDTSRSCLAMARSPYSATTQATREAQATAFGVARDRGVHFRTLLMYEPETWNWIESSVWDGSVDLAEERIVEELPAKAYIFDKRKVLLSIPTVQGQSHSDFTMIILEDEGTARAYTELFEMYWSKSYSLAEWRQKSGMSPHPGHD